MFTDQLLGWAVVILPALFALLVDAVSKEIRGHKQRRYGIVAFGIAVSALTWVQISRSNQIHAAEVSQRHAELESLRDELRDSETQRQLSETYLKTKLEDFRALSQLGPALMKLAQTSADFEREQYKKKAFSNKQVYDFTESVVRRIREFSGRYYILQSQELDRQFALAMNAQPPDKRQKLWEKGIQEGLDLDYRKAVEFRNTILPDALYARAELLKRNLSESALQPMVKLSLDGDLNGILAGINSEEALANYLDFLARQLPLK